MAGKMQELATPQGGHMDRAQGTETVRLLPLQPLIVAIRANCPQAPIPQHTH